jgi:hypothetical protein
MPAIVLAMEFCIPKPDRVHTVLDRNHDALAALGATHVVVHRSTVDPTRVLTTIDIRSPQPVRELLGSQNLFDWFDAVGLEEIPAVFAGEIVAREDLDDGSAPNGREFVVGAIFPVPELSGFLWQVQLSRTRFRRFGIRRVRVYRAFDDRHEVMLLLDVNDQRSAERWLSKSDAAAEWLADAGIGIYPPVFLGTTDFAIHLPDELPAGDV